MRIAIGALKGGAGKSTTAVLLALAWSLRGVSVLLVDADPRSQTATAWTRRAAASGHPAPFALVTWPGDGSLARACAGAREHTQAAVVLVDCGAESAGALADVCGWVDRLIVPTGPMAAELDRVPQTATVAAGADALRGDDGLLLSALLTRVPRPAVGAAADARAWLTGQDIHVMRTEVPRSLTIYADGYGRMPRYPGAYTQLAAELAAERGVTHE